MIIIGCDHSGYELKNNIIKNLSKNNIQIFDVCKNKDIDNLDDYPDIAKLISNEVLKDKNNFGIAICGTGIGMQIYSNKVKGIRAAVINNVELAKLSRQHNDLNIMCLGARQDYTKDISLVLEIIDIFINTKFEGGRHINRLKKINNIEENNGNIV